MDNIAQKIADVLGSAPIVICFGLWTIYHASTTLDYVTAISDTAILIGLLILRAETVQAKRMENDVKRDVRLSRQVLKEIKEQRYMR